MRLMITGINGFVARHFLNYLSTVSEKFQILGLGRSVAPNLKQAYPDLDINYISLDLLDKQKVASIVAEFRPDYLLHLASVSSVGHSWHFPHESFVNNTNIFLNLIEELRKEGSPCRVLSIGSSEEYGIVSSQQIPIQETMALKPINPYAVARVSQELVSNLYEKGYGLDIVMTRSFNHIGPEQSDKFVISSFASQMVKLKKQGLSEASVKTGDISIVRDFVDVRDVVKAYYQLLMNGKKGEVYNICSGKGNSLREVLDTMSAHLNLKLNYETDPDLLRPIDNPVIIGSYSKINNELGWEPTISLDQSLKDILDWRMSMN